MEIWSSREEEVIVVMCTTTEKIKIDHFYLDRPRSINSFILRTTGLILKGYNVVGSAPQRIRKHLESQTFND